MEEERKKYNPKALAGTIIFHAVLLLCFLFFGLSTPLPLPEEEGVTVNLGYTDRGMGERQTLTSSPPPPQPQQPRSTPATEDVATQRTEETVAIPTSPQNRQQRQQDTRQPQPQQQRETAPPQKEPEPEPQPQVDPRALFPGRDRQTTDNQNQGQTGQTGSQGNPEGTPGGAIAGTGSGGGPSFSLTGRRANSLPLPEYNSASQGKVVVAITVNRNGEVVRAMAGERGTTTSDRVLWAAAEAAALKARFDVKNDAPHEQTGTITYNFIRLN
jgi:outer membrane biosynthesis protein TonB